MISKLEAYLAHMTKLINRIKLDPYWDNLSFFNRHQLQMLDQDLEKLIQEMRERAGEASR
jgi:hypothetical protein